MLFDISKFIALWFVGAGIAEARVVAKLKELAAQIPDLRARIDALAAWISTTLAPTHNVNAMKDTIWGIASDLVHGTAGTDPDSWGGSV